MADTKVILVTGASRGIGLAISKYLISQNHNVILTSRTSQPLEDLKATAPNPKRVEIATGDITDPDLASRAVKLAIDTYNRLDGVVLNHGVLEEVKRIGEGDVEGWKRVFDVNFFSCIGLVQQALPHLRKTNGRIVFTSSGAAVGAYSTWGAYGASKAALNHLALTLNVEEPNLTSIAIRPGVVDSEMQREVRELHSGNMDEKDRKKFQDAHAQGKLLRPDQPGNVIAKLVVGAGRELGGQFLSWDDKSLVQFQD